MIDDHAHPFPLEFEPLELSGISLDVEQGEAAADRRRGLTAGRLAMQLLVVRLAHLLGEATDDAVAARNERASSDWARWVRHLFDDADIAGVVLDEARHPAAAPRTSSYADLAGRPMWEMARIDPLVDDLIGRGTAAADVLSAVEDAMAAAAARGCVSFKTIIAYRTGLAVETAGDLRSAQRQLDDESELPVRRRGKALRDLVLRRMLAVAADLDIAVQIHTGYGDSEIVLAQSHPLLLEEVLRTPEGSAARVVLIHGSFPWHQEAAHLAATRPNVWVELSLSNVFAPVGTADRLMQIIDVAPAQRVLLGSDGHGAPETHWFGCLTLRDAWTQVEQRLDAAGVTEDWLARTRDALFEDNARAVYRLG